MEDQVVQVPVALLLDSSHTASAKVVWMARRLAPDAGPAALARLTGLSRNTVLGALSQPWQIPGGPRAKVPGALLAERAVGAAAKVLFGLLQATPEFRGQSGQFTYTVLCALTHLSRNGLKRAVAELAGAGWLRTTQANRLQPIRFTLSTPERTRGHAHREAAERRLKRAKYGGEAIMQEYLSLLVDCDEFTDNARPGFLVNPLTGERLELDRFYPQRSVAFEFHGEQHFRESARFAKATVDSQRLRDLIKAGICLYQGIHLVIVQAEDLTLERMTRKIGQSMPLRDLAGYEAVIELLEEASLTYQASAKTDAPARSS